MTFFNRALWRKTVAETLILLVPSALIVTGFSWLFVYLTNQMAIEAIPGFLKYLLPPEFLQLNSMKLSDWGTRKGVLSAIYIHPIIEFTCIVWAMARGSAAISGEISRGTMEVLLSQPISRTSLLAANAITAVLGAAVLASATVLGLSLGLATVPPRHDTGEVVAGSFFISAAVILFCYTVCMCGICTMISSWDHYRYRTIGIIGVFGVMQIVMDVTVRWVGNDNPLKKLAWGTIKTCFEPQQVLFSRPEEHARLMMQYCSTFLVIALLTYVAAGLIFSRRDIPTPL
jgi:ABC-2 type transport system permease protein